MSKYEKYLKNSFHLKKVGWGWVGLDYSLGYVQWRFPFSRAPEPLDVSKPFEFCCKGNNVSLDSKAQRSSEKTTTLSFCLGSCCSNLKQP